MIHDDLKLTGALTIALNDVIVEDKNEYITDKYGRLGNLTNIATMYNNIIS